jgi:ribosomal protein L3 glutamine methyltransferase
LDSLQRLQADLAGAGSREAWLTAVTAFLAEHDLWYGHGTDSPATEAFWLLEVLADDTGEPASLDTGVLTEILRRRVQERVPLAYLLGEAWFAGLPFRVDSSVLIPRSPLAEIIERGFSPFHAGTGRLLDLGTGCGCIALAAAYYGDFERVDAVDIDSGALAVAALNTTRLGLGERVSVIQSDFYASLGDAGYDIIISNPPYVPTASLRQLPPEYSHEPTLALAAGELGLDCVETIFRGAAARLLPGGMLFLEVGEAAEALERRYPEVPFLWLDFERGGEGVLALEAEQVREYWLN